jgi:hypothetical protein
MMVLKLIPPIMKQKNENPEPKADEVQATVNLTVHLRPGLQIDDLAALQHKAAEKGVPVESLILQGIKEFLASDSKPVAA